MRQYCQGVHKKTLCLSEEEENTGIRFNKAQQQVYHPAHLDEQQQL